MSEIKNSIIFVPGISPKPAAEIQRDALWQSLIAGVQRADPATAKTMAGRKDCFRTVPWNYDFYGTYRDFELDREGLRLMLEQPAPTERDRQESETSVTQLNKLVISISDRFPAAGNDRAAG